MKIDANWLGIHGEDIRICGRPVCCYCDKPCRKGSWVDHLWPYFDQFSWHESCHRKAEADNG